jgi:DNA primase
MARIPEETIREIRDRIDIVSLIGRYVDLRQNGRSHKGLCPFHEEKTASFTVDGENGVYYCHGACKEGGDAFGFLAQKENLNFPEAVRQLAREVGVDIPEDRGDGEDRISPLVAANELAQRFFRAQLDRPEGEAARRYLASRGIDAETIESVGIGFAPDRWDALSGALRARGIADDIGQSAGLLVPPKQEGRGAYDRFRGRVTFPILDVGRRPIGFGARALEKDQQPKYLNTPETPLFRKRKVFYGLPDALSAIRKSGRAILCEGYFDRIALARAGMAEGLATCGTALTEDHANELRRRRVKDVVLLFDGDAAGHKALERSLEVLLPKGLRVRAVSLPPGHDPDSFLEEAGAEALCEVVDSAPDAIENLVQAAVSAGVASPAEKADRVDHLARFVVLVPNPVERDDYVAKVAAALGARIESVEKVVWSTRRGARSTDARAPGESDLEAPRITGREREHGLRIIALVARHPEILGTAERARLKATFPDGDLAILFSRLFEGPVRAASDGTSEIDWTGFDEAGAVPNQMLLEALTQDASAVDPEISPSEELAKRLDWFDRKRQRDESGELTRKLRDPEADAEAVLAEKQRLIEDRRAAQRSNPGALA